jgi:general secretion pathway protein D
MLIADLTDDDIRALANQMRNAENLDFIKDGDFQTAHVNQVITQPADNPDTIKADLLRTAFLDADGNPVSMAALMPAGSTAISLNDANGQTFDVLQILQLHNTKKVLSHPHFVAVENQPAKIIVGEQRLVPGGVSQTTSVAVSRRQEYAEANLSVEITPRISGDVVNMMIKIEIDQFLDPNITDANKVTRRLYTNANVGDRRLLAIGGLTRTDSRVDRTETPLLARVPILGWFFKRRNNQTTQTQLTVFISPTIVQPRLRGGVSEYTKDYVEMAKRYAREGMLFDSMRDPITRFFFYTNVEDPLKEIDAFVAKDEFVAPAIMELGDGEVGRNGENGE